MSEVFAGLGQFILYAVTACVAENAVLGRSLGTTRLVQLVEDDQLDTLMFCFLLTLVQVLSAPLCCIVNQLLKPVFWHSAVRPFAAFVCTCLVLTVVRFFVRLTVKGARGQQMYELLPLATFNTCVLGTILVCSLQSYNMLQYIGFSLGSGVGYLLALMLASEGQRKINRRSVPAAFRGLPITLIYLGILSMVVYSFTGHMIAF